MRRSPDVSEGMTRRAFLSTMVPVTSAVIAGAVQRTLAEEKRDRSDYRPLAFIQMDGGAAGIDTFDPKENKAGCEPLFRSIPTSVARQRVTELFPHIAKVMHHGTLFRARKAASTFHLTAMQRQVGLNREDEHFLMRHAARTRKGQQFVFMQTDTVLNAFDYRNLAFRVAKSDELHWDARQQEFPLPEIFPDEPGAGRDMALQRAGTRHALLLELDQFRLQGIAGEKLRGHQEIREIAFDAMRRARDVMRRIDDKLVARYSPDGKRHQAVMGILAMRELLRSGLFHALFLRVADGAQYGWDTHVGVHKDTPVLAGRFDRPVAELVKDLKGGQLGDAVIVVDTEFGRNNYISEEGRSSAGRDHALWHSSMLFSSNVRGGITIGSTNQDGEGKGSMLKEGIVNDEDWLRVIDEALILDPSQGDEAIRREVPIFQKAA